MKSLKWTSKKAIQALNRATNFCGIPTIIAPQASGIVIWDKKTMTKYLHSKLNKFI